MTEAHRPFPWAEVLHFGLGLLRLGPEQFWRMTPREVLALAGGLRTREAPDREILKTLMRRWPDEVQPRQA